jgi:mono/diheme cytochrome c family protein
MNSIKNIIKLVIITPLFVIALVQAADDTRKLIELPEMMQEHMKANMRDHLLAINEILAYMKAENLDKVAKIAEKRLGMSSLNLHGASHMAKFMPKEMRKIGQSMHKTASRFAMKAEEGDLLATYQMLGEITSACVACHTSYKIK